MKGNSFAFAATFMAVALALLLACEPILAATRQKASLPALKVLAIETFLADIARNVAGDRLEIDVLLPLEADPHIFEPTPADVGKVAESNVLLINGAGFEEFLTELVRNAGGVRKVIEASEGLTGRKPSEGEQAEADDDHDDHEGHHHEGDHHEGDPHFWLDPGKVVKYVENIRDGLSEADPGGAGIYASNADAYVTKLKELDRWISDQVKQIPAEDRLLVTNHESFGYFADRYGFRIVGAIVPSVSAGASPSARQMALLVDRIRETGAKAIFLETGNSPRLASQVAKETGIKVVTELYTHSITGPEGPAPTYIEMMRYNTTAIVNAIKAIK